MISDRTQSRMATADEISREAHKSIAAIKDHNRAAALERELQGYNIAIQKVELEYQAVMDGEIDCTAPPFPLMTPRTSFQLSSSHASRTLMMHRISRYTPRAALPLCWLEAAAIPDEGRRKT